MPKKPKIKRDEKGEKEIEEIVSEKGHVEITHRRVTPDITPAELLARIVALESEVAALKEEKTPTDKIKSA